MKGRERDGKKIKSVFFDWIPEVDQGVLFYHDTQM